MSKYADMLPERSHTVPAKRPREFAPVSEKALPLLAPGNILQRAALALESPRPAEVVRMQQTLGNRAVGELLGRSSSLRPRIQAKLTVNAPGDEYEREADRVAEQVMRMPAVQRAELDDEDEALEVMTKREPEHAASDAVEAGEEFERQLNVTRGQGQALPPVLKQEFETKFGADFSPVRLHADIRSAEMNRAIQAKAFTHGQDIYLGAGQHGLDSTAGKRLLAHELTHVVQQNTKNELQENPRHSSDGQRNGTTTEGSPSEIGHNLKRSDWAHSSLVVNRTTALIQPKRTQIPDNDWNAFLDEVTPDKKKRVETHYNESRTRGEKIWNKYKEWESKTPEQQTDKKGSTRTFRSKGYKTDIKPDAGEFKVQTYRKMESLFELDEVESKKVQAALESGNTDEIKKLLKSQNNIDTYGELEIKKVMATQKELVSEGDKLVPKQVGPFPEWQITDRGKEKTKSTDASYGRTYVARFTKDVWDKYSILEFDGFSKSPTKQELETAGHEIPYSVTYTLPLGKFTADKIFKDWEQDQTFAEANSEIIWNQYKTAIKAARSANADLKYTGNLWEIEQNTILNEQTLDTIFLCDGWGEVSDFIGTKVVRPDGQDSEDFRALIGTPNGTSAGWLIIDHGTALGLQSLESIEYQRSQMNIKYKKR